MVFLAGEDVAKLGGASGVTSGLYDEYERILNTISETAIIGLGVGSAALACARS